MKVVIKGLNYTEIRYRGKAFFKCGKETVMFWSLSKERKPSKCGVWIDGNQVMNFQEMLDKGFYNEKETP